MKTSYFEKASKFPSAVSIAGRAPTNYRGLEYKILAPKYWFFKKYKDPNDKNFMDKAFYIRNYYVEVLDKLDPKKVYEELGEDAILLCWEKPGEFCHRQLVAEWLMKHLGIEIKEL